MVLGAVKDRPSLLCLTATVASHPSYNPGCGLVEGSHCSPHSREETSECSGSRGKTLCLLATSVHSRDFCLSGLLPGNADTGQRTCPSL